MWYFDVKERDILANSKLWPSPSYRDGLPRADGLVDLQLQWNGTNGVKITGVTPGDSPRHLAAHEEWQGAGHERVGNAGQ